MEPDAACHRFLRLDGLVVIAVAPQHEFAPYQLDPYLPSLEGNKGKEKGQACYVPAPRSRYVALTVRTDTTVRRDDGDLLTDLGSGVANDAGFGRHAGRSLAAALAGSRARLQARARAARRGPPRSATVPRG